MLGTDAEYVPCPVHVQARENPDAVALLGRDRSLTYEELDGLVTSIGARLAEQGLPPGCRVAIAAQNCPAYVMVLLALLRRGFVACPLNVRRPPAQLLVMIRDTGCAAVLVDSENASLSEVPLLIEDFLLLSHIRDPLHEPLMRLGRHATIVYTSGSTGSPRAAVHTYGNHWFNALGANENMPIGPGDRWLLSLPLYHVGGLGIIFRCIASGAAILVPDAADSLHASIVSFRPTHVSVVPTHLRRLLREPENIRVDSLRGLLLGGSPMPTNLIEEALDRGLPIHTSYGLTEMASQVTTTPPGAGVAELRTAGRILPHRELSIAADGEICVRGETLFAGYLGKGGVDLPLDDEGWFHSGDLGRADDRGLLHVTGRRDNLFISGGENIQPEEIERALLALEVIEEAVVVPVPDSEFGMRPVAFVRPNTASIDEDALRARLRRLVPGYMIPLAILPMPEEQPDIRLKPDRALLREIARRKMGIGLS